MADNSKIEWTDSTWNPLLARELESRKVGYHCVKCGPECSNCYAEAFNKRNLPSRGTGLPFAASSTGRVEMFIDDEAVDQPRRWKRSRKIFVCSMTDLFGEFVDFELIDRVFDVMRDCPHHTFQVLTKRPELALEYCDSRGIESLPDHIWFGATAGTQEMARIRLPYLAQIPAKVRFVSAEPLLGLLDLERFWTADRCPFQWVIVGGESGAKARMMHPEWVRVLRAYCDDAGIPFFFKQWGTWWPASQGCGDEGDLAYSAAMMRETGEIVEGGNRNPPSDAELFYRLGKTKSGRLLDGEFYDAFPGVAS